jgi:hypothetical protein
VKLNKLDPQCFVISLFWTATDHRIAPECPQRTYLSRTTGFDFSSTTGCSAASRFAAGELGDQAIKIIDAGAFRGELNSELDHLGKLLNQLWAAWCRQGTKVLQQHSAGGDPP